MKSGSTLFFVCLLWCLSVLDWIAAILRITKADEVKLPTESKRQPQS